MQPAILSEHDFILPWRDTAGIAYSILLAQSYEHWMGEPLILDPTARDNELLLAEAIYEAPFPLMSHGTQPDPIVRYTNRAAQVLWRMEWEEITRIPSRLMAEPAPTIQEERNGILAAALSRGFIKGYSGRRISKRGERFEIADCVVWNVVDQSGARFGQACRVNNWWYV